MVTVKDAKKEQIANAKAMYERGSSIHEISRETKLNRRTITRYSLAEGWKIAQDAPNAPGNAPRCTPDPAVVREQSTSNIIDFVTRKGIDSLESSGKLEEITASLNDVLLAQPRLAAKAAMLAEKIMDDAISGKVQPGLKGDWGTLLGGLIGGAERSVEMVRSIAGLKAGQPSEPRDKAKTTQRRFIVKTPAEAAAELPQEAKEAV